MIFAAQSGFAVTLLESSAAEQLGLGRPGFGKLQETMALNKLNVEGNKTLQCQC
jgi:hypothetical protein